ncbi:ATP synthase f chain, mitochondrial precursor [Dimargaris verticillata]|uniref:ATP synthase f chain, mitochondrial n=1 Tax=Dimargaris verticillata TaxID=2761393 RepID=A0A9W8E9W8_9FUNG|nr:ATP synthase f chain, mitochondrial precursor [Dimargaris verticillata]
MHPILRTTIQRRGYATARSYIPPNLAGAKPAPSTATAAANEGERMAKVVDVYKRLPKGSVDPATAAPKGLMARYRAKYVEGENASFMPVLHVILIVGTLGYANEYMGHLRYHKSHEHH